MPGAPFRRNCRVVAVGDDLPPPPLPGFSLVFRDEFNSGSVPDPSRYHFYPSWGDNDNPTTDPAFVQGLSDPTGYGGYAASNATVSGGNLILTASDVDTQYGGMTFPHRTALVRTKASWLYGIFQARVKLPAGQGLWPALWLFPTPYIDEAHAAFEIDILEAPSTGSSGVYMYVHWADVIPSDPGTHESDGTFFAGDFSTAFHDFEVRWSASEITWWIDGVQRKLFNTSGGGVIPNEPMQYLVDYQVGGSWPGLTDGTTPWPTTFECDYIRIWQED